MVKTKSKFKVVVTLSTSPQGFKLTNKKKFWSTYSKILRFDKTKGKVYRYFLKSQHFIFA